MEDRRQNFIETMSYSIMRFLGSAARSVRDGFYSIAPFMRPEEPGKIDYVPREKRLIRESAGRPALETAVVSGQEDLFAERPAGEIAEKAEIAKGRQETIDTDFFGGIVFDNKLEAVKADIFVKDFQSPLRKVRAKALKQLKEISKPAAVGILRKLLFSEEHPLQIIEILNTLSSLNDDGKLDKRIFTNFLKHSNSSLRQVAIRALARYRDGESFSIVYSCLNDGDGEVRRLALNCLSWFFSDKCAPAVVRLLHDVDNRVRKSAILISGSLKLRQSVSALITLLSDPDNEIQKNTVASLRKITGQSFGFKSTGSKKSRQAAIEDWRFWWRENQTKFGTST